MSRYIDADALKKRVSELIIPDWTRTLIRSWLDSAPTVDAVQVVRCRDCKYCYAEGFVNARNVCEKHYDFGNVDDDWFCADGERRTDEQQ